MYHFSVFFSNTLYICMSMCVHGLQHFHVHIAICPIITRERYRHRHHHLQHQQMNEHHRSHHHRHHGATIMCQTPTATIISHGTLRRFDGQLRLRHSSIHGVLPVEYIGKRVWQTKNQLDSCGIYPYVGLLDDMTTQSHIYSAFTTHGLHGCSFSVHLEPAGSYRCVH